ncbi:MAG: hypothetical protein D6806_05355, partial [Deltaproteobacteria bacterium]
MKRPLKKPAPVRCANCTRVFDTWHAGRIRCPYCSHELQLDVPEEMLEPCPPREGENTETMADSAAAGIGPEIHDRIGDREIGSEPVEGHGAEMENSAGAGEHGRQARSAPASGPFRMDAEAGWTRRFTDTLVGVMFRPTEFFSWMDGEK